MENKNKKIARKKMAGLTFLEAMIVIAIIGIMTAIGIGSAGSSRNFTKLKAAQSEVASTIKTAQNYALQGKVQPGETICGYGFGFVADLKEYKIYYINLDESNFPNGCSQQNNNPAYRQLHFGFYGTVETYQLPDGVLLSSDISSTNIFFDIPNGNIYDDSGNAPPAELNLDFSISGKTKSITINQRGSITEN